MKKFLFFFVLPDGRTLTWVNGLFTISATPKQLPQAPDGSQEISVGWERSATAHGNIRNFALPLGFLMDAAKILRHILYTYNIDYVLHLVIKRLTYEWTSTTYKEYYKYLYKGQIDFSTASDDQGGYRVNVGIMEGGVQRLLKANESTTYEIPLDLDAKNVRMDGMYIAGLFRWTLTEYATLGDGYPGLFQLPNDNPIPGLAIFDVMQRSDAGAPDAADLDYFAESTQTINGVVIEGRVENLNNLGAGGPLDVRIYKYNSITGTVTQTIDLTPADPYAQNYNLVINETVNLVQGDRLFFKSGSTYSQGVLSLRAKSKPPASTIQGFTLYDLGRKLTEKITGSADNFESTLLADLVNAFGREVIITSGDGIRSIKGAAVKTSWAEYWKFVDVLLMAQYTITDKLRLELRLSAYTPESTTNPATELGEAKDLKITPAIDQMGTSVKVGHAEPQTDDTNGKFDFTGPMIFNLPIKGIPDKQIDLQTGYKTSPYEIEQKRANYEGKTTTDSEIDNDIYALAVLPDPVSNSFSTTGSFLADGTPIAPGQPLLSIVDGNPQIRPGMKLKITGTASNDQDVTVKDASGWFFGQLIITNEPLVNEASVTFTIEIIEGQYYDLDRSIPVTQLISPDDVDQTTKDSVFNVSLSPKRILLRHRDWLAGVLAGYGGQSVIFSSANRNKELIAGGIVEKADVLLQDPAEAVAMFKPWYFEFDTVSPVDMVEILEATPNPVMAFTWKGTRYTGFLIRGGIALNDLEEQNFKLLACPENDLLPLIA